LPLNQVLALVSGQDLCLETKINIKTFRNWTRVLPGSWSGDHKTGTVTDGAFPVALWTAVTLCSSVDIAL